MFKLPSNQVLYLTPADSGFSIPNVEACRNIPIFWSLLHGTAGSKYTRCSQACSQSECFKAPVTTFKAWFTIWCWSRDRHGKKYFFTSQILFLVSNFSTIWLVECWLMLAMQRWNRNRVYSSVTWHLQCYAGTSFILWTRLNYQQMWRSTAIIICYIPVWTAILCQ